LLVPVLLLLQGLAAKGEPCPAPNDIEARVRTILHLGPAQQLSEGFAVERRPGGLHVVLRSADSTLIGERTLPVDGSCDELAQAAAVVISAWLTDVHPDFASELPPPPAAEPQPAPEPKPEPKPTPVPAAAAPKPRLEPAPPRRLRSAWRWEAALGAGVDLGPGFVAPSLALGFGLEPRAGGFGGRLQALVALPHEEPLGSGQVRWLRWPVGLGPSFGLLASRLRWSFSVGPALGWLHFQGKAFDQKHKRSGVTLGGFASVRVAGAGGPWTPFLVASAQIWPAKSVAYVSGIRPELALPPVDFLLAFGVALAP
jgi:hypothetical protein